MAFRLTTQQIEDRDALVNELRSAQEAVEEAVDKFNEELATLQQWASELADKQREVFDKRSAEFQESDWGQMVSSWIEAFSDIVEIEQIDLELPAWEDAVDCVAEDPLAKQ